MIVFTSARSPVGWTKRTKRYVTCHECRPEVVSDVISCLSANDMHVFVMINFGLLVHVVSKKIQLARVRLCDISTRVVLLGSNFGGKEAKIIGLPTVEKSRLTN